MDDKQFRFNEALKAAKNALDEAGIPFHLAAGTALGATRDKKFIDHDHDIDLAVFLEDYKRSLTTKMKKWGFHSHYNKHLGTLKKGKEYGFIYENGVPLDIFLVYKGTFDGKEKYWIPSFFDICDKMVDKTCKWLYRPYKPRQIDLYGVKYLSIPPQTLIDAYGRDWKVSKKFNYQEGMEGYTEKKKKPMYRGLYINPAPGYEDFFPKKTVRKSRARKSPVSRKSRARKSPVSRKSRARRT